ncbi:hypothetical protein ACN28E_53590 [Archangium lansingense]|uniref:hypothetical protein n=1 Tax=Archangium lansingense TaxID=2995310 RepID=UPI003B78D824
MQGDGGDADATLNLDALLTQLAGELERVHAHLAGGPLRLGPVEVELRGAVATGSEGAAFRPGGSGEVRAYFVGVEPEGVAPVTPELRGLTRSAAARKARASGAGLEVTVVPCASAELAGRVCWQRPAPGEPQASGRIEVGMYSAGR